jgi:hypothetical protein
LKAELFQGTVELQASSMSKIPLSSFGSSVIYSKELDNLCRKVSAAKLDKHLLRTLKPSLPFLSLGLFILDTRKRLENVL